MFASIFLVSSFLLSYNFLDCMLCFVFFSYLRHDWCYILSVQSLKLNVKLCFVLQNVGFIGLGNMGSRMAVNLIKSGFKVSVHDM